MSKKIELSSMDLGKLSGRLHQASSKMSAGQILSVGILNFLLHSILLDLTESEKDRGSPHVIQQHIEIQCRHKGLDCKRTGMKFILYFLYFLLL